MNDNGPMMTVTLPLAYIAALQAAGQFYAKHYEQIKGQSPIMAEVVAAVDAIDQAVPVGK